MVRRVVLMAFVVGLSTVACSRDSSSEFGRPTLAPSGHQGLSVGDIASAASVAGVDGMRRPGTAPASTGGPRITATGNQRVINGGTQNVLVNSDAPFTAVYVYVGGRALGIVSDTGGGVGGYYEVQLGSPQTSATVLLSFPQEIPLNEFDLQFAVKDASGAVGPYVPLHTTVTVVGTGDVQVTLSWDVDSDVDLHVVAPGGEEIFYGHRSSSSGGTLDLDSNAGCTIDGIRNENITWPVGRAPRGVYTVRVDYWSSCAVARTEYSVRINNGGAVQIFTGSFTGGGDAGGAGSGRQITTFERLTGPTAIQPLMLSAPSGLTKIDRQSAGSGR